VKSSIGRFGFFHQRVCWFPTLRGWLAILVILALSEYGAIHEIHPFLAPNEPTPAGAMVIEGWVDDVAVKDAIRWVRARHYHPLFVTGAPIVKGATFFEFGNIAELTAASVRSLSDGMVEAQPVPTPDASKDRTFASALALKDWMAAHGGIPPEITVFSEGPHSRRSWLLYQKAFGASARIGIIASPPVGYDPLHWWKTSEGFRTVTDEAIAYGYARLIFWPPS
jgi:hypothetical protein